MQKLQTILKSGFEITNHLPRPLIVLDCNGMVVYWNNYAEKTFGYSSSEVLGKRSPFSDDGKHTLFHEDTWEDILSSAEPLRFDQLTFNKKNGGFIFASIISKTFTVENNQFVSLFFETNNESGTDQCTLQEFGSLKNGLESSFMVVTLDQEGLITFANQPFLKKSNWTPKRVLGKTFWQLFPEGEQNLDMVNVIWNTITSGNIWQGEVEKATKDGQSYWVNLTAIPVYLTVDGPSYYYLLETDITEKKLLQNRLEKIAYIDQETGLINRHRLEQIVTEMIQEKRHFSFVYISIDKFYALKDMYEDHSENTLLNEFVKRMKMYFQDSVMARVNIDEFAVLTPLGEWFTQGLLTYLKQHPIYSHNVAIPLSISGGITKYPEDQQSFSHLLKASLATIEKVRQDGGGNIASLTKADHKALSQKAKIEQRLLKALDKNDLKVLYQPQLNLEQGKITSVEAFVRWEDEEIGTVPPEVLIPIAEENGFIHEIGSFMLEQACRQAVIWQEMGHDIKVSINSSVREFRDKNMVKKVREVLENTKCPAHLLQIEITEKFALEAEFETSIIQQMKQLQDDGIVFVLDDFGTGYASFRYMQLLPIAELKIDQTFISTLHYQEKVQKLIHGMVQFGKSMNMRVLAEGVETKEQQEMLAEFGCDAVQGYYISHPVTAEEVESLL